MRLIVFVHISCGHDKTPWQGVENHSVVKSALCSFQRKCVYIHAYKHEFASECVCVHMSLGTLGDRNRAACLLSS